MRIRTVRGVCPRSGIFYFGAEFTKVYANKYGSRIRPNQYAVFIEKKEIQTQDQAVSLAEKNRDEIEKEKAHKPHKANLE